MLPIPKDSPPTSQTPWQLSAELFKRLQPANPRFKATVVLPTDPESKFIVSQFMKDRPLGYGITKITCVYNQSLHMGFLGHLFNIEEEAQKFSSSWQAGPLSQERRGAIGTWKELTDPFSPLKVTIDQEPETLRHAKVLPLWHGTSPEKSVSICASGFTYFGKHAYFAGGVEAGNTDIGYFGSGIYFTESAQYAAMYSKGCLLLSWVSMREPYPVVSDQPYPKKCTDMLTLEGKGAYQNYDAHFVPVAATNRRMEYYPCFENQKALWHEIVVFQKAQALPSFIIEIGAEPVRSPSMSYTFAACYAACRAGDIVQVQSWILEDRKRLCEEDMQGENCLFAAVLGNQMPLLMWLLSQDPALFKKCRKDGTSLMHMAAAEGHVQIVFWLHRKDPTMVHSGSFTPLYSAALCDQSQVLQMFLEDVKKNTSLIEEIVQRPCPKSLQFLLKNGLNPNQTNKFQQTLLHLAAYKGQAANIEILLEQGGASINAQDLSKKTPLYLAVVQGHLSAAICLLDKGADPRLCAIEGDTILHVAAFYGYAPLLQIILKHPIGRTLIHVADGDGKQPIHKAVWTHDKPDVMQLLLEAGAHAGAKNAYDYTPLHWAAKHGHAASAQVLIKAGASWDSLNKNNDTPLDLAIKWGQNQILCTLLGAHKTLPEEPVSKDAEGYYYRRLVTAKTSDLIEEQIIHLIKLGLLYTDKNDLLSAAKILNGALHLVATHKGGSPLQKLLLKQLAQIEEDFFTQHQVPGYKQTEARILKYRTQLCRIRIQAKEMLDAEVPLEKVQNLLTEGFKGILCAHINEIQNLLGKPPVEWACIGMGSMARAEMCPNSDIEFAFILKKETPEALDYFRRLSQILALQILNLGETKFPIFARVDLAHPSPTPNGFSLDSAGNSPLGVPGIYELIASPKKLAGFQTLKWIDRNIILPNALSAVCFVAGNEKLVATYREAVKKEMKKERHTLAFRLLAGHLQEFRPNLCQEKEEAKAFGIKKELYRPFQEILGCLSLFFELKERGTLARLGELVKLGVFSAQGAAHLKTAILKVLEFRVRAHLFYKDEIEYLFHLEEGQTRDASQLYLEGESLKALEDIYKTLIPFHRCAEEFYQTRNKKAFRSLFYDDSPSVQGQAFQKTLQYAKAQVACQQAVSLNPNDIDAQLFLGDIEEKMGKSKEALPRNLKALALAQQKYGENHPDVATCYSNIGNVYNSLGEYEKALEFYQKALKIQLQVLGENHPSVATSYNNIGFVYDSLGEFTQALEFYQKALKIQLQVLGENHPDVATSYNNIGSVYDSLGEYEKALEFYQKALKIRLQVLGGNHPSVATSYNNIGMVYNNLGEFTQALEFYQKALKIQLQALGENHPDVATSYNNIGSVYAKLGEYEKALKFLQKALKIQLQVLGENHPSVATSYNNIGSVYDSLGEYEKALEFHQKGLKVFLQVYGENHPNIQVALKNLIACAEKASPPQVKALRETSILCKKILGKQDPLVQRLIQLVGKEDHGLSYGKP